MVEDYYKPTHHINGWDSLHFINLCASCGFELVEYQPLECVPLPQFFSKIPLIGPHLPQYIDRGGKIPLLNRLSYTMYFLFVKRKDITIAQND